MKKRLLACLLTAAMLVSLFPLPALAAEAEPYTGGLCPHHTEHSYEVCGYIEAVEGQLCGHVHDGDCGFVEAVPEVPCDMDCAETGEDSQIIHVEGCAYAPEVEGAPCQHAHDGLCGYVEAVEGQPCGYVCPTCSMQAGNDLPALLADETEDFTVSGGELGTDYSYTDNTLTILTDAALTIFGTTTTDRIVVETGVTANVTLDNVSIQFYDGSGTRSGHCAFEVAGTATCNLTLKGDNTLKSGNLKAGLQVQNGAALTINGPGSITANGGGYGGAGIGGGDEGSGGTVTINGGTITAATGDGYGGAGIGGGDGRSGGTLRMTGGILRNTNSTGNTFTMTGGTLDNCTINHSSATVNQATIQNSTVNNLSSWTDENITVSGSTLKFSSAVTLTKGGGGNTYNSGGTVTIAGNAAFAGNTAFYAPVTIEKSSFSGNTTFGSTVDITGNVTLDGITELTGNVTIDADGSLTNSGSLAVPKDCIITNRGTIINSEGAVINLSGVIDNQTDTAGTVANNGTIFLIGSGQIIDYDNVTGDPPVPAGATPIPAGEIVIDLSTVSSMVTIGPESYTIDGTSHTYDPAQNNIVLTGTYNNANISGTWNNHAAAVTVLENTTASIVLRDVYIGWEYDRDKNYCSSIWVKDYCTITVFLEGTNTLKPRYIGNGICTEEHSSLTVEGAGTLILDMSSTRYGGDAGIGNPNRNFGSITLNGGNIVTRTTNNYRLIGIGGEQGTVTINGGTLNGPYLFGDSSGGNITNEYQLIINGGIINSETKWSLRYGSLTINGGQMSIPTVYCNGSSGGKIAVNGGQLTLTSTSTSEYMYGNITINGGTVTGRVNPTLYGGTKINGGTAKLTNNSDSLPVASIKTTDGKTAYCTELKDQTSVADLLVDGKSQNISYNHPSDTSLYLYLVHDDNDTNNSAKTPDYFKGDVYIQHNTGIADGLSGLGAALAALAEQGIQMIYTTVHQVLAQGNFVLAVSEGTFGGAPTSYYDLWRVEDGKIAEHWDVMETIADQAAWANQNGKF